MLMHMTELPDFWTSGLLYSRILIGQRSGLRIDTGGKILVKRIEAIAIVANHRKRLGITVFQPRLKVCTFARTNYYEYGKQRQVQESP